MIELIENRTFDPSSRKGKCSTIALRSFFKRRTFKKMGYYCFSIMAKLSRDAVDRTVSSKLQDSLSDSEIVQISRVVILDQNDPVVSYLQGLETISNGGYTKLSTDELSTKFKFTIRKAYLLRSQKLTK